MESTNGKFYDRGKEHMDNIRESIENVIEEIQMNYGGKEASEFAKGILDGLGKFESLKVYDSKSDDMGHYR